VGKFKHGGKGTRLYCIWKDMRRRCRTTKGKNSVWYTNRGIKVCDEWQEFIPFRKWALSNGYTDELTIDRKDVNGNYEPSNCRWIPMKEQAANRRGNVLVEIEGETKTISEWARHVGISQSSMNERYHKGLRGKDLIVPRMTTMKGKHHTEETKERMRNKLKGEGCFWYGKKRSDEDRLKMSLGKKNKRVLSLGGDANA